MTDSSQPGLLRRLRLGDAVFIGLGSMIGAGVFAVWAPAAQVAGEWLLLGLGIALLAAYCNATSSAQLAAQYPTSGGTYIYGREQLGQWPGFLAGWGFVVGKTASVAAMGLTFGQYAGALPGPGQGPLAGRVLGSLAVLVLATVNCFGVTRTARLTRGIVVVVLIVLALAVLGLSNPSMDFAVEAAANPGPYQVVQSAGLLFFAFAGYARIATLGEEVVHPGKTIPRAILIALGLTAIIYFGVAVALLRGRGAAVLADAPAPLAPDSGGVIAWLVTAGAGLATVGAMLNLMTGIGRTTLAMARNRDLPRWLAAVDPKHRVPRRAEVLLAVVVCALVWLGDLRTVIGFSSFGVLAYYAIANAAALSQEDAHRRFPKPVQVVGFLLCLLLVVTLPWQSVLAGVIMYAAGVAYRLISR